MRPRRLQIAAATLVAFAALAGGSALAYFSASGAGIAPVGVSSLAKTTITAATPAVGGTVTLTWSAVSPPTTEPAVTYYVTRDGEPAAGSCPTEALPVTVLTCVDKGLEPGTHTYAVTAVWRSWSSESNPATPKVTIGAATQLALSASSTSPLAGAADNLTIAAKDSAGTTVTNYTGSHSLTFSGAASSPSGTAPTVSNSSGTATAFGAATAITFTAGVATISSTKNGVMKLYRAGEAEIGVTDGAISDPTPLPVTVAPAAFSKFTLGAETTTPAVGAADGLTITAFDTYGNVATSVNGSRNLTFSGPVASPGGYAPTVTDEEGNATAMGSVAEIDFEEGVAEPHGGTNGVMRLYKSASASLKVAEGSINASVTVVAVVGPAVRLNLAASTVTPTAGASDNLTETVQDTYGNTVTGYTGAHELTFEGASPGPAGTQPTVSNNLGTAVAMGTPTAITFTNGVASISSTKNGVMKIYNAEPATITVSDGTLENSGGLTITVATAALSKFALAPESTSVAAGAADDLTITAEDTYANVITTYTGTHNLVFSGATASPGGNLSTVSDEEGNLIAFGTATEISFKKGVAENTNAKNGRMRIYRSGTNNIKVTEGSITNTAVPVVVSPLAATKFLLGGSVLTMAAGGSSNLTTTAQDIYGNTATTYTGSHTVTFEGALPSPGGTLPTVVNSAGTAIPFGSATALTFTSGVAATGSSKNGLMKLYNAEPTTVEVSDGTLSNGSGLAFTVTPTTANKFVFTNLVASRGSVSSTCLATCTVTGIGLSGTIKANVAVADTYGNTVNNLGTGHTAAVTTSGGTIGGGSLPIPSTGAAESTTQFTFTSQSTGNFTDTIKAAASAGTAYTNATITATK